VNFFTYLLRVTSSSSKACNTSISNGVCGMNQLFGIPLMYYDSYQDATDQIIAVLYFHSINILFDVYPKKYQENVEASQLNIYSQSICPENGCSTNLTLSMESEEGHHRAEVTYPHNTLKGTSSNIRGTISRKLAYWIPLR
jgi:hypothetical protein